jgi:hypothetical protein
MIKTEIWKPRTRPKLDKIFDDLRQKQYADTAHPLYANYTKDSFNECERISITFDDDIPICCASIIKRTCWPDGVYRILNRFWKVNEERLNLLNTSTRMQRVSDCIKSQQEYCFKHFKAELVFISRQEDNWQKFLIHSIKNNTGYTWNFDEFKYQTCNDENENCWQKIIYFGNDSLLESWNKK